MSIDFQRIADAARAQAEGLIMELFPHARRDGGELRVGSINGEEGKSLSINLGSTAWKDFATGDCGGDLISLYAAKLGLKQSEAAVKLDERLNLGVITGKATKRIKPAHNAYDPSDWVAQPFSPDECTCLAPTTKRLFRDDEWRDWPISQSWEYRDSENHLVGYVCRVDYPDGTKDVFPYTYCIHTNKREEWRFKAFAKPRPLYRLPDIIEADKPVVLVVEGEKTADAAKRLLPGLCVTTWPGGSQAMGLADFAPLRGRSVLLWPDADEAGTKAMASLASKLIRMTKSCLIILPPEDWVNGYDLADAERDGWDAAKVMAHIDSRKKAFSSGSEIEIQEAFEQPPPEPDLYVDREGQPFDFLGHDGESYYYLPHGTLKVIRMTAQNHSKASLLQLAPTGWWKLQFGGGKGGVSWYDVADWMLRSQERKGLYNPMRIRGRGAWIDEGRLVFHAGDKLYIDNEPTEIRHHKSRFIYEQGLSIGYESEKPASSKEAARLIEVCEALPLKSKFEAKLLAGWCVIAPICGALDWRPHLWISGSKGTGKSWCLDNIIKPMLGEIMFQTQGSATEAGIRQSLRSDARPVVFDEAESEDQRGHIRMQSILELARQSSSETGASIVKGSASGDAVQFFIRSCFCFSSIGVAATKAADISRVTTIELVPPDPLTRELRWADLQRICFDVIGRNGFCGSVRARALELAPVIRDNAKVFANAISRKLGDQRIGDQIGAACAGAFALTSRSSASREVADAWVSKQDWGEFMPQLSDSDEAQAFNQLVSYLVRVDGNDAAPHTKSIGELIQCAFGLTNDRDGAIETLLRHGIKMLDCAVVVANRHPSIQQIYHSTQWADKWSPQLLRLHGAEKTKDPVRFGTVKDRGVILPDSLFVS